MPEHLRALVVILAIATVVWTIAKVPMTALANAPEDFKRRRNLWFVLTLAAFLAHNFWLFVLIAAAALAYAVRTESNRYALYMGLMLTLPKLQASIPGLGVVNELFAIDQLRLLSLVILLPTYLTLRRRPGVEPFGSLLCDKLLLCIFAIEIALTWPYRTFTSVVRDSVLYAFTDIFLTYYVASRSLRSVAAFRDALAAFVAGAMVFCAIVAFEFAKRWLLYRAVDDALGASWGTGGVYLMRAGLLRAEGTAGQSIICGYTCAVALGLYLYVQTAIRSLPWRAICLLILLAGLIGALARAPWLGACMMVAVYILLGPSPFANFGKLAGGLLMAIPILVLSGASDTVIDFLPWVGTVDSSTVEGRERLATVAMQIIRENPIFGRFDYALLPALEVLRDGSGLIDLVNTYIIIALKGGLVSLGFFVAFIAVALFGVIRGLFKVRDRGDERHALGRALLATLAGVLFIIATVSPIFFIWPIYWMLAGLAVGYGRMIVRGEQRVAHPASAPARGAVAGLRPRYRRAGLTAGSSSRGAR